MKYNKAMFNVDPKIWKAFRMQTLSENKTATEVIVKLITDYLNINPNKKK